MAGAPILTGPINAWERQGWESEDKKRDESRLQKMKALTELANQAASEGRELSVDEWFNIANNTIGASGLLHGDAPTSSMLESIRANANQKAQEVARQRDFNAKQDAFKLDDQVRSRVEEMARSGASPEEIASQLHTSYGSDIASKYTGRIQSFASNAQFKDQDMGMRLGATLQSTDEAERYLQSDGQYLTDGAKRGVREAAKSNQMRNDALVSQIATQIASRGGFADDQATRTLAQQMLPAHMQTPEYVDKVMGAARGVAGVTQRDARFATTNTYNNAWAQSSPQFPQNEAMFQERDQQAIDQRIQQADRNTAAAIDAQNKAKQAPLAKALGSKNAALAARATEISGFLENNIVPLREQQDLYAALNSGDESKVKAAVDAAQRVSVSAGAYNRAQRDLALAAAGRISGPPEVMYDRVANVSRNEDDRIMMARGAAIRQLSADPNRRQIAQAQLDDAIRAVVSSAQMTRNTLGESGVFGASGAQIAQMEQASIRRALAPLAQSSGIDLEQLVARTLSMMQPPQDIAPRSMPRDTYRAGYGSGLASAGLPGGVGAMVAPSAGAAPTFGGPSAVPVQGSEDAIIRGGMTMTPADQAWQAQVASNPALAADNLRQLDMAIARETNPNTRAVLLAERQRLGGAAPTGVNYGAPAPASLLPPVAAPSPQARPAGPTAQLQAQLMGASTFQLRDQLNNPRASQSMKLAIQAELLRRESALQAGAGYVRNPMSAPR